MTADPLAEIELLYHSAMPGWCKIVGLRIKVIPEGEGGGFAIDQKQAERIQELVGNDRPHH